MGNAVGWGLVIGSFAYVLGAIVIDTVRDARTATPMARHRRYLRALARAAMLHTGLATPCAEPDDRRG